ncbi:MAG: acylphosphatase [Candidatus Glassbacteria bacterium]
MRRNRLRLRGYVQGVGCRFFICRIARKMGVVGYVKNLPDGSVEVRVEGDDDDVATFIDAIKDGPPGGRVDDIKLEEETPTGEFKSFTIEF